MGVAPKLGGVVKRAHCPGISCGKVGNYVFNVNIPFVGKNPCYDIVFVLKVFFVCSALCILIFLTIGLKLPKKFIFYIS